jgi:hypothetical protein
MTREFHAGVESANLTTAMKHHKASTTESHESVKLGIDAHAKLYEIARHLDGETPQPVQKIDFEKLLQGRREWPIHTLDFPILNQTRLLIQPPSLTISSIKSSYRSMNDGTYEMI